VVKYLERRPLFERVQIEQYTKQRVLAMLL
jgi:hypothetical protein